MKKNAGIILRMVLVFSLCACGSPNPTNVANDFMAAVKSQDAESLKTIYPASKIDLLDEFDNSEDVNNAALQKVYEKQLKPGLLSLK